MLKSESFKYCSEQTCQVMHIQTHISNVYLVGGFVYKLKKEIKLGFLDYSTLAKRKYYCDKEVELNKRLAPSVYIGVVAVRLASRTSILEVDSPNEGDKIVDYAVKLVRLDDRNSLLYKVRHNKANKTHISNLLKKLHEFYENQPITEEISNYGSFRSINFNVQENFEQTTTHVGNTVSAKIHESVKAFSIQALYELENEIEGRMEQGYVKDCHGDLRLEHCYFLDDEIAVIDCIEFNDRFRYSDVLLDIAFLYMDILFESPYSLPSFLLSEYLKISKSPSSVKKLFIFYAAYRSIVRAKVVGIKSLDMKVPESERNEAREKSSKHWLIGLSLIAPVDRKPALVLVYGLPGCGKSTVSKFMKEFRKDAVVIRSDFIRKELTSRQGEKAASSFECGIYTSDISQQTYSKMLELARSTLLQSGPLVIIDASFNSREQRENFRKLAFDIGIICFKMVRCYCEENTVKKRLQERTADVSDADLKIYEKMKEKWEDEEDQVIVKTDGSLEETRENTRVCLISLMIL